MKKFLIVIFLIINILPVDAQRDTTKEFKIDVGITRDCDIIIFPIFRFQRNINIYNLQILYPLYIYRRDYKAHTYYSHFLPFYISDSTHISYNLRILSLYYPTLFYFGRDYQNEIWRLSFVDLVPGINFLQLSKSKNGLFVENNLFFFIFYKNDYINKKRHFVCFPFYWDYANKKRVTHTLFPFFSFGRYNQRRHKYFAVTPLFWHKQTENGYKNIFFPVFWNTKKVVSNDTIQTSFLFPLFYSRHRNGNLKASVVFPVLWIYNFKYYNSFTLIPFFSFGREVKVDELYFTDRKHLSITPLFWYFKEKDFRFYTFFPIFWHIKRYYRDNYMFKTVIYPIYKYKATKESKKIVVRPIFFYNINRGLKAVTVFPFYSNRIDSAKFEHHTMYAAIYWRKQSKKSNNITIFPLYYDRRYDDGHKRRTAKIFFPTYWEFNNRKMKSLTIIPLFSMGISQDSTKKYLAIFPAYIQSTNKDKQNKCFFPIWWYSKRGDADSMKVSNIILPIFFKFKDVEESSTTLLPLFSVGRNYNSMRKHLVITPLYWNVRNYDKHYRVFFPLWYQYTDINKRSFTRNRIFFPIYWKFEDNSYKSKSFFPLFSTGYNNTKTSKHLAITPLYWHLKQGDKVSNLLLPIFYQHKTPKTYKLNILPIMFYNKTANSSDITIIPLFSKGYDRRTGRKHFMFTPLFWDNTSNRNIRRTNLIPIFSYTKTPNFTRYNFLYFLFVYKKDVNYTMYSFIYPLCEKRSGENYKYLRIAPILWYKRTKESEIFTVQPFYYQRKTNNTNNYYIFWLFFTRRNEFNHKKSTNLLWKTIFYDKYSNGDYEFRFLYLVLANVNKNGKQEKSIFPLFHTKKDDKGNKSKSYFFYFYNYFERKLDTYDDYYREERIFWVIRLRSNYAQLKREGKL